MATTIATMSLSSNDLLTDVLALSTSSSLTEAGNSTGLTLTSGLARKTTTSISPYVLFYADDYTANLAHKLYVKNTETVAGLYFTISNGDETLGRIYAQDWALIPWSAVNGTPATFTAVLSGSWAEDDTLKFDGTTITCGSTETPAAMQALIAAGSYTNWTAVATTTSLTTFTAKRSDYLGLIEIGTGSDDWVNSGSGVTTIARGVTAVASANDIKITPSTTASHTLEYMLFNE